jgi:uncharacterized RmlC-like cupin family protein
MRCCAQAVVLRPALQQGCQLAVTTVVTILTRARTHTHTHTHAGCNIKWAPGQEPDYYGTQIVQK